MKDSSKDSEFEGGEADVNATEWLAGERESGEGKGGAFTPPTQLVCSTGKGRGRVGPKKKVVRTRPFGLRLRLRLKRPLKTTSYITETPPPPSPSSPSRPSPEKESKGAVAGYTLPLSIYRYRRRRRRPYSDVVYCRSLSWNLRFLNRRFMLSSCCFLVWY